MIGPAGDPHALARRASAEVSEAVAAASPEDFARLVEAIAAARRIACHGVGREGLMMRALAMRLFHMGLDAHVVGDMTTPPLGEGDLLLVSAGPGGFSTVDALMDVARAAGAATACITAQPDGSSPSRADTVFHLPAQTMANDTRASGAFSVLPMGSLYEGAQYIAFEVLVILLRERLGIAPEAMRARHTNLE